MSQQGPGARVARREDRRFVTGKGRYVGDLVAADALRAVFLRSPHAHAGLGGVDGRAAERLPGVVAVLTGRDMAADGLAPMPLQWDIPNADGSPLFKPPMPALAVDALRFVGQPYAMVIAESEARARDGAELVEAEFEERPAAATLAEAMRPGAPAVWPRAAGTPPHAANLSLHWTLGDREACEAVFAAARHVVELELVNQRLAAMPIEPRLAAASYDEGADRLLLLTANQCPHELQRLLCQVFGLPETRLDVVAPDIGGGFGMKAYAYPEEVALLWAARRLGGRIAWTGDRSEGFLADSGGRDHLAGVRLALDGDGRFLALAVEIAANMGAYLSQHAPAVPTVYCTYSLPGPYRFGAVFAEVRCFFSHSAPIDAYRGAGRSEAVFVTERAIDEAARRLGIDAATLRRRNLVAAADLPYATATGSLLESGDAPGLLQRALRRADAAGFAARRRRAQSEGRLRGLGIAMYAAACGGCASGSAMAAGATGGSWESARLQVHPSGAATLFIGSHNHGQGHETVFAQVVAGRTGIALERIEVAFGDTRRGPRGMGSFASRSAAICGPAVALACERVVARARRIAAHLLDAEEGEVELRDGIFTVAGSNRHAAFDQVALAAHTAGGFGREGREPGLDETGFYDPQDFTWPFGAHIAEVEIDPETGAARLLRYVAVDDFGAEINPMIVDGQLHGGIAQGAGQALMEAILYDPASGQLLTGSFMDYAMPRATALPAFETERLASPCSTNPLGAKGAGEAGTFAAPAAIANACADALAQAGGGRFDMPASPLALWQALRRAAGPPAQGR